MVRVVVVCLLGLLLGTCGSSGGGGEEPTITQVMPADLGTDGWISSSGLLSTSTCGFTGDLDHLVNGVGYRQFMSFFVAPFANFEVVSAQLAFYVFGGQGPGHGDLILDHVDVGATLDAADFAAPALEANIGAPRDVSGTNLDDAYWYLDVTNYVRADRAAGRARSQFRARFAGGDTDVDGLADYIRISTEGCVPARPPILIVQTR